ncbi:MAG: DinB family protein [Phycisphaeraceae bacterium]
MDAMEAIRAALRQSYDWNRMLAEDMRDVPLTFPTPTGGNHPVWVVGHAAFARAALLSFITGEPNPLAEWEAKLGGQSQPSGDGSVYPSYDEVMALWEREHQRTLQALAKFGEAGLDQPALGVPPKLKDDPDFQTVGRIFLFTALHEMSHRGQLADARRALGRGPLAF